MHKYKLATVFSTIPETLTPDTFNLMGEVAPFLFTLKSKTRDRNTKNTIIKETEFD